MILLTISFLQSSFLRFNLKSCNSFSSSLSRLISIVVKSSLRFDVPLKDRTFGVIGGVLLTEELGVVSLLVSELGGDNKCCGVSIIILEDCDL